MSSQRGKTEQKNLTTTDPRAQRYILKNKRKEKTRRLEYRCNLLHAKENATLLSFLRVERTLSFLLFLLQHRKSFVKLRKVDTSFTFAFPFEFLPQLFHQQTTMKSKRAKNYSPVLRMESSATEKDSTLLSFNFSFVSQMYRVEYGTRKPANGHATFPTFFVRSTPAPSNSIIRVEKGDILECSSTSMMKVNLSLIESMKLSTSELRSFSM